MRNRIKRVEVLFEFLRVLVAMVIAYALVLVCISFMVEDSVEGIRLFVLGPFESKRRFGNIISRMITLMLTGAGMCFCYASNRFNLAGEGAFMISGCVISLCAISWADAGIPHLLFILILLVIGAACGVLAASVPAVLREKVGANELVVSIMSNYVFLYLSNFVLKTYMQDRSASYLTSPELPSAIRFSTLVARTDIHGGLFVALLAVIATIAVFYLTPLGMRIRICGNNEHFAQYSGINMTGCLIVSQLLGGMLSGLGGAVEIMGNYERFNWIALTQYGFDGLMVAVLARKNPIFIPFGAFLLAYMRIGANVLNVNTSVPIEFVQVMQAVLILFIAAQTFLAKSRNKVIFKAAEKRSAEKEAAK